MGSPLHHDVIQVVNKSCKQLIMLSVDKARSVVSVSIFEIICLMIIENICTSEPLVSSVTYYWAQNETFIARF